MRKLGVLVYYKLSSHEAFRTKSNSGSTYPCLSKLTPLRCLTAELIHEHVVRIEECADVNFSRPVTSITNDKLRRWL